ncbi:hypothetical protein [Sorangium sp. So ce542]|uniref:hypothetical protein n=1 Tax=Sorangium sp. So ce542 TaxID=3133316 RepID=UPI003F62BCF9
MLIARDGQIGGPAKRLVVVLPELDLDDDDPHRLARIIKEDDDDIGPVLGGRGLGQIDGGDSGLAVGRERDAEDLDEDLGGEGRSVSEEIHEDLVAHGGHG